MQATLTDVQKAIEQLGHSGGDAASFSFASSHGDAVYDRSLLPVLNKKLKNGRLVRGLARLRRPHCV